MQLSEGKNLGWTRKDCDSGFLHDLYRECEDHKLTKKNLEAYKRNRLKTHKDNIVKSGGEMSEVKSSSNGKVKNVRGHQKVEKTEGYAKVHRSKSRRERRSEVKSRKENDIDDDDFIQYKKELQEIENELMNEDIVARTVAAARKREKTIKGRLDDAKNAKRSKMQTEEIAKEEVTKAKDRHTAHAFQITTTTTTATTTTATKTTNNSEVPASDAKNTTGHNSTKQIQNKNSTLRVEHNCNGSGGKCLETVNETHHHHHDHHLHHEKSQRGNENPVASKHISEDDKEFDFLNNNATSRHEKILKILTWLDNLLKSEKKMYAHKGRAKNQMKHHHKESGNTEANSSEKKTNEKEDVIKSHKIRGMDNRANHPIVEEDIDEVTKKGSAATRKESGVTKNGIDEATARHEIMDILSLIDKRNEKRSKIDDEMRKERKKKREDKAVVSKRVDATTNSDTGSEVIIAKKGSDVLGVSKKEVEKRLIAHCKLTAHVYYLAVRGFGKRYYKESSAKWCQHNCVQKHGIPNTKKYKNERAMM
eukprot:gene19216-21141_t